MRPGGGAGPGERALGGASCRMTRLVPEKRGDMAPLRELEKVAGPTDGGPPDWQSVTAAPVTAEASWRERRQSWRVRASPALAPESHPPDHDTVDKKALDEQAESTSECGFKSRVRVPHG